ncbi:MAG: ATP-dependent 6-phosphofructokinase [Eubacteriales bacterium]
MRKIGILTGGGDCPGLNAVIRGVVETCSRAGIEVMGLRNGWKGAIEGDAFPLTLKDVEGLQVKGGTILGSSRTNVMKIENGPEKVRESMKRLGLEGIVAIGGDDTLGVANQLTKLGMPMVGVPKTIDNDLSCTDYTFGFDTSANIVMEAIDRLRTTADSHARIMVVEIMGRHTGWIAVQGGIAGDANIILIPEFPKSIEEIEKIVLERKASGHRSTVIAVAEGFKLKGYTVEATVKDAFGNACLPEQEIGKTLAKVLEERTGIESRYVVLGHLQRGGSPSAFDRVLSLRLGAKAGELVANKQYGNMVALSSTDIVVADLDKAVTERKLVDKDLYQVAELLFR